MVKITFEILDDAFYKLKLVSHANNVNYIDYIKDLIHADLVKHDVTQLTEAIKNER